MNFLVTVRLVDRQDAQQPEPFFLGPDAEWTSVELMLKSLYSHNEDKLDVRYWDDEDYVILSSQEELDEACRLASEKGILQLYVRSQSAQNCPWPESNMDPVSVCPTPKERPAKRTATEAFTAQNESAVDPSAHAIISLQVSDTVARYVPGQESSAASAEDGMAQNREGMDVATAADAGASDPEHTMIPGASSGANVIAIEMPDCPMEVQEATHSVGDQQGTEAAEPAEMAETGEIAPKSGRDAETGFWMVPKNEKNECTTTASASSTQKDVQPKAAQKPAGSKELKKDTKHKDSHKSSRPKDTQKDVRPKSIQKDVMVKELKEALCASGIAGGQKLTKPAIAAADKSLKKKKHSQTDALTQEAFLDYMTKYQSELRRDIVKDVTRKTVRQVVAGVSKIHTDSLRDSGPESGDYIPQESKSKWPISVHDKIICDHCDQLIVGPRFKCGNCINYDLCECCESIYPPVHNATHVFLKLHKPCPKAGVRHGVRAPLLKRPLYQGKVTEMEADERKKEKAELDRLTVIADRLKIKEAKVKEKLAKKHEKLERRMAELIIEDPLGMSPYGVLSAEFVCDVNLPDNSIVRPGTVLEKTWMMRNNGTINWPADTELAEVRGNLRPRNGKVPLGLVRVPVGVVLPRETKNISVMFCTPEEPGNYESYWRLHSNSNGLEFGHNVFFKVCVRHDESLVEEIPPPLPPRKEHDKEHKRALETALEGLKEESTTGTTRKATFEFPLATQKPPSAPLITEILESSDRLQMEKKFTAGAVPATPNNTPFAVSPPSGRCISPSPKPADIPECSLVNISISECPPLFVAEAHDPASSVAEPKVTSTSIPSCNLIPLNQSIKNAYDKFLSEQEAEGKQRKSLEISREGQEKEAAGEELKDQRHLREEERITCYEWLKEQAAAAASRTEQDEGEQISEEGKPTSTEFDTFQSLTMLKLIPSAPVYDPEGQEDVEGGSTAAHNGSEEDFPLNLRGIEQGIKSASDADSDGFVMCPCGDALPAEAGSDSADDDLYASAHSPKMLELEMPIVGASPVMPNENAEPDDLSTDAHKVSMEELRYEREMSPGSTASSVEVVSVADLDEFEKGDGEEEYRSIDTHGAWLSPRHMQPIPPVADLEKELGEGYEILPDDLSSMSDESSIDEDFCIVIPDCFDMTKPLKRDLYLTEMESHFSGVFSTRLLDEKKSLDQAVDSKSASPQAEAVSCECGCETEEKQEAVEHSMAKVSQEMCGGAEKLEKTTDTLMEMLLKEDTTLKQLSDTLATFEAKLDEEDGEEKSRKDGQEEQEQEVKEELENEENQKIEQEQAEADSPTHPARDEKHLDEKTEELAAEVKSEEDEAETEVKTQEACEPQAEGGAAAAAAPTAPTVVDVIDPGQHLNHLVQSTVKAATNGLQHLYQTTKDVIKTLQAETYEVKESSYEYRPSNYMPPTSSWKPSESQYVPPRSDYQPPKSDYQLPKSNFQLPKSNFQLPKSTYSGPQSQTVKRGDEYAAPLARIREMGYFNDERSLALLKKYQGDVHMVVDELCQETDNNWADCRH